MASKCRLRPENNGFEYTNTSPHPLAHGALKGLSITQIRYLPERVLHWSSELNSSWTVFLGKIVDLPTLTAKLIWLGGKGGGGWGLQLSHDNDALAPAPSTLPNVVLFFRGEGRNNWLQYGACHNGRRDRVSAVTSLQMIYGKRPLGILFPENTGNKPSIAFITLAEGL